jgi:hypothetical protein
LDDAAALGAGACAAASSKTVFLMWLVQVAAALLLLLLLLCLTTNGAGLQVQRCQAAAVFAVYRHSRRAAAFDTGASLVSLQQLQRRRHCRPPRLCSDGAR